MKGRNTFTKSEGNEIIKLIEEKLKADTTAQKRIRNRIRKRGFYASDFGIGSGYTVNDFLSVVTIIGGIQNKSLTTKDINNLYKNEQQQKRTQSDEAYIIDLCDQVLGKKGSRQHKFDFLRGDPGKDGKQGVKLPVDAYYCNLNLVIEYRERQHTEEVNHFDKPDKMTISGVHRGDQRKIYDQRRREVLPKQGIELIEISYDDFNHNNRKKIVRNKTAVLEIVQKLLVNYIDK